MRACGSCGEAGIREHSVLVPLAALTGGAAGSGQPYPAYARCARCGAVFRYAGPDALVPQSADALHGPTVWLVPPWKAGTDEAAFAMSWDLAEAFFEDLAADSPWLDPICALIRELRAAGFDARLRAGQSLSSLGLSRSREHGLRADQSHLFVAPQPDGSIVVTGSLRGEPVRVGPVPPALDGPLRPLLDQLLSVPID